MKLLIVDDSLIVRNVIGRNARHSEIVQIFTAADGEQALTLFREHRPELVTMDLTMPNLDGLGCLRALQSFGIPVSILVVSAINSHRTAMEAIAAGACGFLTKPFSPEELSEAVAELVDHARSNLQNI